MAFFGSFFVFCIGVCIVIIIYSATKEDNTKSKNILTSKQRTHRLIEKLNIQQATLGDYKSIPLVINPVQYVQIQNLVNNVIHQGYKVQHSVDLTATPHALSRYNSNVILDNKITLTKWNKDIHVYPVMDTRGEFAIFELQLHECFNGLLRVNKKGFYSDRRYKLDRIVRDGTILYYMSSNNRAYTQLINWNPVLDMFVELLYLVPDGEITFKDQSIRFVTHVDYLVIKQVVKHLLELDLALDSLIEVQNPQRYENYKAQLFYQDFDDFDVKLPCVICYQPLGDDYESTAVYLSCCGINAHVNHLNEWLLIKEQCPNCRSNKIKLEVI